jgi:hypothetical protein
MPLYTLYSAISEKNRVIMTNNCDWAKNVIKVPMLGPCTIFGRMWQCDSKHNAI